MVNCMSAPSSQPNEQLANTSPGSGRSRHRLRKATCVLLACESMSLFAVALYSLMTLSGGEASALAVPLALFFALFGLALVGAARSLWNFGRFGVSFGVTWQLFQALVGASLLRAGLIPAGAFAIIMAVVLFVVLLKPENRPARGSFIE